mgnify:CR=1 FL=1
MIIEILTGLLLAFGAAVGYASEKVDSSCLDAGFPDSRVDWLKQRGYCVKVVGGNSMTVPVDVVRATHPRPAPAPLAPFVPPVVVSPPGPRGGR